MPRQQFNVTSALRSVTASAGSRGTARLDSMFQARSFQTVTYVEGDTLRRWCHRPDLAKGYDQPHPKAQFFLIYTPTPLQLETACDRCPTYHKPKNMACSANTMEQASPFTDPFKLYNYLTPQVSHASHAALSLRAIVSVLRRLHLYSPAQTFDSILSMRFTLVARPKSLRHGQHSPSVDIGYCQL